MGVQTSMKLPQTSSGKMLYLAIMLFSTYALFAIFAKTENEDLENVRCPNYGEWSRKPHHPYTKGKLSLPYQRPPPECRTFHSSIIEAKLKNVTDKIRNEDLARLFENTFPNTLDTTIRYHQQEPPLTFIVTGDIDAQWLRDSQRQLMPYVEFCDRDQDLANLFKGAIALQARYVAQFPFCNAFQPPRESKLSPILDNSHDSVVPRVDPSVVFECKYELDSLASFLGLSNDFFDATKDSSIFTTNWRNAVKRTLEIANLLSNGTYDESGKLLPPFYSFQRWTNIGTETLPNQGRGNPCRRIGMIRSAFRPSDDASVYQFSIPGNAQFAVELKRISSIIPDPALSKKAADLSSQIRDAIWKHGIVNHPNFGRVFAYEVDGYGSHILMDDANIPSLLSLPDNGFIGADDPVYLNTRQLILSEFNPYYTKGFHFKGIGSPHVGLLNAWPMSRIVEMRTTHDVEQIVTCVRDVMKSARGTGLIHESINVRSGVYTRSWFAWANSEFAKSILHLEKNGLLEEVDQRLLGV